MLTDCFRTQPMSHWYAVCLEFEFKWLIMKEKTNVGHLFRGPFFSGTDSLNLYIDRVTSKRNERFEIRRPTY